MALALHLAAIPFQMQLIDNDPAHEHGSPALAQRVARNLWCPGFGVKAGQPDLHAQFTIVEGGIERQPNERERDRFAMQDAFGTRSGNC